MFVAALKAAGLYTAYTNSMYRGTLFAPTDDVSDLMTHGLPYAVHYVAFCDSFGKLNNLCWLESVANYVLLVNSLNT
jgi:hypothetical protein